MPTQKPKLPVNPTPADYAARGFHANVLEIMATFRSTGRIGMTEPKDAAHAQRIARAISRNTRDNAK